MIKLWVSEYFGDLGVKKCTTQPIVRCKNSRHTVFAIAHVRIYIYGFLHRSIGMGVLKYTLYSNRYYNMIIIIGTLLEVYLCEGSDVYCIWDNLGVV